MPDDGGGEEGEKWNKEIGVDEKQKGRCFSRFQDKYPRSSKGKQARPRRQEASDSGKGAKGLAAEKSGVCNLASKRPVTVQHAN